MALLLLFLTIGIVVWTLANPSPPHWSDDPAWRQEMKQWRREQRRQDWAKTREVWRTHLWHTGDGAAVLGLLALAAVVIVLWR